MRRRKSNTKRLGRRLRMELLEPRQMLAATTLTNNAGADEVTDQNLDQPLVSSATTPLTVINGGAGSGSVGAGLRRQVEDLNRGVVAVRRSSSQVYIGWRLLGNDPTDVAFNLYRSANGGQASKLNLDPLQLTTDFVDSTATLSLANQYFVRAVIDGVEQQPSESFTLRAAAPIQQYLDVPLQRPAGGTTPDGVTYTYNANDASVGDLDGDGQYEIILKWDPSNAKDNANAGFTGNVYIDAYNLDGTPMWRIDLGRNIRAGAHYTQLMVYDLDGDGRAEVATKTAPGTVDGLGNPVLLGSDLVTADYRNGTGYVLTGPEYFTVFDGLTGAALDTVPFEVTRGSVGLWGDTSGNRVDRFTAGVAYLDGTRPSLVFGRGYYERSTLSAWDYRNGQLTSRWIFDSEDATPDPTYEGEGAHSLSIADVDNDGRDEVIYGAAVIDDDGTGLYSTGLGHGDALHVSDMIPSRPGLEIFMPHENVDDNGNIGASVRDAETGELIFSIFGDGDIGRGVASDIDPNHPGYEYWATTSNPGENSKIYNSAGAAIYDAGNVFYNFLVWWDADLSRELLDEETIANWNSPGRSNLLVAWQQGADANNGTKSTPSLSADILGDWREEVIWRRSDNSSLMIFTTTAPANNRLVTLMHDTQYREAIAWQNVGYNQPPHPSFFLGTGMVDPPRPKIYFAGELGGDYSRDGVVDAVDYTLWRDSLGQSDDLSADGDHDGAVTEADYQVWKDNFGAVAVSDLNAAPSTAVVVAASPTNVTGMTTTLSVLGADDEGEANLTYSWWATGGTGTVTFADNISNTAKNTVATFSAAGTYRLTATIRDADGNTTTSSTTVTVNQILTGLQVGPGGAVLLPNAIQQFTAIGYDQFGQQMNSLPTVTWSVDSGGGTINSQGRYTAPNVLGSATVRAMAGAFVATADVSIAADTSLRGWWKLDETSGTDIGDSSGFANNGIATNGPTFVAGQFGNALRFDGSNDYVALPNNLANSAAGSVSMWINSGANFTDIAHLFYLSSTSNGNGLGAEQELHVNFTTSEQLQFYIKDAATGVNDINIISPAGYANNAWHHVVATWDITGSATLYVDGAVVGSVVHDAANFSGSSVVRLGRPGAGSRFYNGLMDDVRLFNVAISAAQVQALFSGSGAAAASFAAQSAGAGSSESLDVAFASLESDLAGNSARSPSQISPAGVVRAGNHRSGKAFAAARSTVTSNLIETILTDRTRQSRSRRQSLECDARDVEAASESGEIEMLRMGSRLISPNIGAMEQPS
jgi:rhamnogalacturonan endolyase